MPDGVAPIFQSANVIADGSRINIVFNEPMLGGGTGFTLSTGNTLTFVSGGNTNTLVYKVVPSITSGQTPSLSYSSGTSDATGQALLSFSAQAVTNNSTITITSGGLRGLYFIANYAQPYNYPKQNNIPNGRYVDTVINFNDNGFNHTTIGVEDYFNVRWLGFVNITTAGTYNFQLSSDDGSVLFIDETYVADASNSGNITLTTGYHRIDLRYYEVTGGEYIQLYWTPPSLSQVIVPAGNLYYATDNTAPFVNQAIIDKSGLRLLVKFGETIYGGSDGFSLSNHSLKYLRTRGNIIEFEILTRVLADEVVTLTYVTGTPVQDVAGNSLAAFSNSAVTNNSTQYTVEGDGTSDAVGGVILALRGSTFASLAGGSSIAAWADSSYFGNDAIGNSGERPVTALSVYAGRPIARFDGSTTMLRLPAFFMDGIFESEIVSVLKNTNDPSVSSKDAAWQLGRSSATNYPNNYGDINEGFGQDGYISFSATPSLTTFRAYSAAITPNNYNNSKFYATLDNSNLYYNNSISGIYWNFDPRIGGRRDDNNRFLGDIADILIYDHKLSTSEQNAVYNSLTGSSAASIVKNVYPDSTVASTGSWTVSQSNYDLYRILLNKRAIYPESADGSYYMYNYNLVDQQADFSMTTVSPVSSASQIKIYLFGSINDGGSSALKVSVNIKINGTWQTAVNVLDVAVNNGSQTWGVATFTGTYTQTNIDDLQIRVRAFDTGSGNNSVFIHELYAEISYAPITGLDPNGDVANTSWTKIGAASTFYGSIAKTTRRPTAPATTTGITTSTNGAVIDFDLSTATLEHRVAYVRIYIYGTWPAGLTANINNGSWQIPIAYSAQASNGWQYVEFAGPFTQSVIDNLKIRFTSNSTSTTSIYSSYVLFPQLFYGPSVSPTSGTPTNVPGCMLWYDANAITGKNNGDLVDTWIDGSGYGRNATQTTDIIKPTYKTARQNGLPALSFSNNYYYQENYLTVPDDFFLDMKESTIFIALRHSKDDIQTNGDGGTGLWNFGPNDVTHYIHPIRHIYDSYGSSLNRKEFASGSSGAYWRVYSVSTKYGEWTARIDNELRALFYDNYVGWNSDVKNIGRTRSGYFFYGDIGEVIIYNRTLTTTERNTIYSYLNGKWGYGALVAPSTASYYAAVMTDVPSIYYRLNELDSGGYYYDSSGYGNHAIVQGFPIQNATTTALSNMGDKAARFRNQNNYLQKITQSSNLLPLAPSWTFEFFIQINGINNDYARILETDPFRLARAANGDLMWYSNNTGWNTSTTGMNISNTDTAWYHIVVTNTSGTVRFYKNSVLQYTQSVVPSTTTPAVTTVEGQYLFIGADNGGNNAINANLDEFAFYNYALSQTRITAHYSARVNSSATTALELLGPNIAYTGNYTPLTVSMNGTNTGVVVTPSDGVGGLFSPTTVTLTTSAPSAVINYIPSGSGNKTITLSNNASLPTVTKTITVQDASGTVQFLGEDATTQGTWKTVYGSQGQIIPGLVTNVPSWATVTLGNTSANVWSSSTTDVRATQQPAPSTDRYASYYQDNYYFDIYLDINDNALHQVEMYFLNWDTDSSTPRSNRIEIVDFDDSNKILYVGYVTNIDNGKWERFKFSGKVRIRLKPDASYQQALVSALMFDTVLGTATTVSLGGPTVGPVNVASSNFTVQLDGTSTSVVVTPSATGGTFSPTSVTLSTGSPTGTFTFTPTSTGVKTISISNNAGLINDTSINYVSGASLTVPNFSFETPSETSGFAYNPSGATWVFLLNSGITGGGGFEFANSPPNGTQAAFLQDGGSPGSFSQTLTTTIGYVYVLAYSYSTRSENYGPTIQALWDTTVVSQISTGSLLWRETTATAFTATATSHSLKFKLYNTDSNDKTAYIDNVKIYYYDPAATGGTNIPLQTNMQLVFLP